MKLALSILIFVLCSAGILYNINVSKDGYSGVPYFYTCATSRTPPGPYFAWPVNNTFLILDYYAASRITNVLGDAQYIASSIW